MQVFRQEKRLLQWKRYRETVQIEPWGADSLRVRVTPVATFQDEPVSALLPPTETQSSIHIGDEEASITNGAITAHITAEGLISFTRTDTGAELLSEAEQLRATRLAPRMYKAVHSDLFHLEARFKAYDDERIYGLGQHQHGRLDQKGCTIDLIQRNAEISIPFLVSSRGYGFLWHNPGVGRVELGAHETRWVAEATAQIDYWITAGDTPAEILRHYADATGHPTEFPEWASGFWQCKLRYRTQEELLSVAHEYKRRGLPISVIIIDFFNWTAQGDWRFDPEEWPDPTAMVRELDELGIKLMVSVWPTVNPISENYETMVERDLLIRTERGAPAFLQFQDKRPAGPIDLRFYDATNPEARQFIWDKVRENYSAHGVQTFWLDACEPEMEPIHPDNLRFHLGNGLAVANAYPLLHERGFYEHMQEAGQSAILNLCRSGWIGSQRYGAAIWSGDIASTFEALQVQVRAGLNMAMSGIPWWTTDIGGFYGADIESQTFHELIIRWFQYAAFCPIFRLHGYRDVSGDAGAMLATGGPNEAWSFGNEAYEIIKEQLFLRERLRPYLMEQMRFAQETGIPPMRPLFFDFPADRGCNGVDDQFLLGPDLLVAPVLTAGTRQRSVYLPAGTVWTEAWGGQVFEGGQSIVVDAPLTRIPVYLRGDAQVPIA